MVDPEKPSQDFLGLTVGAMGWDPNITPAMYPPVSEAMTHSMNVMMNMDPGTSSCPRSKLIMAAKLPNRGIHVSINTPMEVSRT